MPETDIRLFGPSGYTLDPATWGPSGVRGPDKVAQRFLFFLFTPAGTIPGRPGDGTDFLEAVQTFRSEFDLYAAFSAAEPVAGRNVRSAELTDDPDSEKYGYARLSRMVVSQDALTLTFAVVAADGSRPADPVDFTLQL